MNFTTNDGRPANKLVFISWSAMQQFVCFSIIFAIVYGVYTYLMLPVFFRTTYCRAPDSATVKKKMIFAGSKDALTRAFVGVGTKVSATDMSEITEEILIEACKKFA